MKLGFTLIVIAGIAGLVGALAPIDGGSLLPAMLEFMLPRGLALGVGFAVPAAIGAFALAKERMSKPLAFACLAGFLAAGASIEIWKILKALGDNIPVTAIILGGAVVLGLIGSVIGLIKGNND
jgi:hypothetical protein